MARIMGIGAAQLSFGSGTCRDRAVGLCVCFGGQCADQLWLDIWQLGAARIGAARCGDCFGHIPNTGPARFCDLHPAQVP